MAPRLAVRVNNVLWTLIAAAVVGCTASPHPSNVLTLATTTSTRDSGLLDVLVPMFEADTGIRVKVVAVGSGQALALARRGDADVLLTHAPDAEADFMRDGYGSERHAVMYNDFVLVGPPTDPARVAQQDTVRDAFRAIAQGQTPFISRGDESGTHMKEKSIWRACEIVPAGDWYERAGDGMAAILRIASEKRAYTLTDRGTFLAQRDGLDLAIVCENDPLLHNPYTVIVVSRQKHPHVNQQAARRFAQFLCAPKVQEEIREFGKRKFGQPLFFPCADAKSDEKLLGTSSR